MLPIGWIHQKYSPEELLEKWASYNDIMWTLIPIKYIIPNKEISHILEGVNYNPLNFYK